MWIMCVRGRTGHSLDLKVSGDGSLARECNTVGTFSSDGCFPGILLGIHISIVYNLESTLLTLDDLHNSSSNSCSSGNV